MIVNCFRPPSLICTIPLLWLRGLFCTSFLLGMLGDITLWFTSLRIESLSPWVFCIYGFGPQVFITYCFAPQAFDIPYFASQAMNIQHFGLQAFDVHCFGSQAPGVWKHLTHIFFYSQALVLVNLARESLTSGVLDNKPLECAFGSKALAWLYTGVLTLNFWCTGGISIHKNNFTDGVVDVSRGGER